MPASPVLLVPAAATAAAAAAAWLAWTFIGLERLPLPQLREIDLTATVVSTLDGTLTVKRVGRVRTAMLAVGAAVRVEDPLFEFDDLVLMENRADLAKQVERERGARAQQAAARETEAQSERSKLRVATLRHIEDSFKLAQARFDRWKILVREGLVARVEFEKEQARYDEAKLRLEKAQAAASEEASPREAASVEGPSRAERLLVRLNRLPDTFVVRSPWSGRVLAFHVAAGDTPERGAPLATIARTALGRLEAAAPAGVVVTAVRSACGVPGPFPFTFRDGVVTLPLPPSLDAALGRQCSVLAVVRDWQQPERN